MLWFGSSHEEDWTPESDIDLFVVGAELKAEVWHHEIDGVTLEIQVDQPERLLADLEAERGNLQHRNLATMIATAEVVQAGAVDVATLQETARAVLASPPNFTEEDLRAWRESVADYLGKCRRDLARQDAVAFQIDAWYVIENLLNWFLATRGSYWPQPKHMAARLQGLDAEFAADFTAMAEAQDPQAKLEKLEVLAQQLNG